MDRNHYYSPESLFNRAQGVLAYGIHLELAPGVFQAVSGECELLFACKVVSAYHVSLHQDDEIEAQQQQVEFDEQFMDTTSLLLETLYREEDERIPANGAFSDSPSLHREDSEKQGFDEDLVNVSDVDYFFKLQKALPVRRERRNVKLSHLQDIVSEFVDNGKNGFVSSTLVY
jgi:hypothetical protein